MPVTQLKATCWLASFEGDQRTPGEARFGVHFQDRDKVPSGVQPFCKTCSALVTDNYCTGCDERRTASRCNRKTMVARPLTGCFEVHCDRCETELDDDEVGFVHYGSLEEAAAVAAANNWSVYADGRAFCSFDAPPPGPGLVSDREPAEDQPALFGGAK